MTTNSDGLTVAQINERLGFPAGYTLLWSSVIRDILGVKPTGVRNGDPTWTEAQFVEIAKKLRERLTDRIDYYEDEDSL